MSCPSRCFSALLLTVLSQAFFACGSQRAPTEEGQELRIIAFEVDHDHGEAPLKTNITWLIDAADPGHLECSLQISDSLVELQHCPLSGALPWTFDSVGVVEVALHVTDGHSSGSANTTLYVNGLSWVPNLVRVHELIGLTGSSISDDGVVELHFESPNQIPEVVAGTVLWDRRPQGFIAHVVDSSTTGSMIRAATTPGDMFDLANDGFWGIPGAPAPMHATTYLVAENEAARASCEAIDSASVQSEVHEFPTLRLALDGGETDPDIDVVVENARLLVATYPGVFVSNFSLTNRQLYTQGKIVTRVCGDFVVEGAGSIASFKSHIPGISLGRGIDLGPLGSLSAGFIAKFGVDFSGSIGMRFSGMFESSFGWEVRYNENLGENFVETEVDSDAQLFDIKAEAAVSVKAYLQPTLELLWGHPRKSCSSDQARHPSSFKMGFEAEVGAKAEAEFSVGGSGYEICVKVEGYSEIAANFIPPFKWMRCYEQSMQLFPPETIVDKCWPVPNPTCPEECATCVDGVCLPEECIPQCGSRNCGDDPLCGESCGTCLEGKTCDNGYCVDLGSCGNISSEGACEAGVLTYCAGGVLLHEDCELTEGSTCGWNPTLDVYTCIDAEPYDGEEDMVRIPAVGDSVSFMMGCPTTESLCLPHEQPQHPVELSAFEIDRLLVTTAEYRECFSAGACEPPAFPSETLHCPSSQCNWNSSRESDPINGVVWSQAVAYCQWRGARLPTEAEWEFAATGGSYTRFPWGDQCSSSWDVDHDFLSWCGSDLAAADLVNCDQYYCADGYSASSPVGAFPLGASASGLLDMGGNVSEWVYDRYAADYYSTSPILNPQGPESGKERVRRGGNWNHNPKEIRTTAREFIDPAFRNTFPFNVTGFRCARSVRSE